MILQESLSCRSLAERLTTSCDVTLAAAWCSANGSQYGQTPFIASTHHRSLSLRLVGVLNAHCHFSRVHVACIPLLRRGTLQHSLRVMIMLV